MACEPEALTDVLCSGCHRPPELTYKLLGVQSDLNDVVEQSQQGSQRERCHKDGGEAKLQD